MGLIVPSDKKVLLDFIKIKYPMGSLIFDDTRSLPYKVKKSSIFVAYEWDYSVESTPLDVDDVCIDFLVRDSGKNAELYSICSYPRKWCKI